MDRFHELLGAIQISFKLIVTLQEWVNVLMRVGVVIRLRGLGKWQSFNKKLNRPPSGYRTYLVLA